ncbi:hypothetical protein JCGZ_18780 [Jatropha curcas]|uniref:Uncharacterized protein n=1 Tax=Jatropha curcas TaxID=180498 RepID=A0A067LE63_JATCU|nr:hypothetical protein JCGZ_18780 [Jatropha curcas]
MRGTAIRNAPKQTILHKDWAVTISEPPLCPLAGGDIPFPPGMEVTLDPTLGLGLTLAIPADLRQVPPQLHLDPEHTTHGSIKMNLLSQKYLPGGFFIESSLAGACSEVSGAISEVLLCPNLYCQTVPRAPRDGVRDWQATETSDPPGRYCFLSLDGE